jgi:glycosyltransferase involved in cell wall biosynthesis
MASRTSQVSVVIPAARDANALGICVSSVLTHTKRDVPVYLLCPESGSTDVNAVVEGFQAVHPHIRVWRGVEAIAGLPHALAAEISGDVAFLPGLPRVGRKWLHRLASVAGTKPDAGSASALTPEHPAWESNGASLAGELTSAELHEIVEKCAAAKSVTTVGKPAGCTYLRRPALNAAGWGAGGNAESVLSLEHFHAASSAAGFVHYISLATLAFPSGQGGAAASSSAGQAGFRPVSLFTKIRNLIRRHPPRPGFSEYFREEIESAVRGREEAWNRAVSSAASAQQPILYVVQDSSGGTPLTNEDLMSQVSLRHPCFLLRTSADHWTFSQVAAREVHPLKVFRYSSVWQVDLPLDRERTETLLMLCRDFRIALVHFRHFLGSAPECVELLRSKGICVVTSLHDYYAVCPNIQLIGRNGSFCGGRCATQPSGGQGSADCFSAMLWKHPGLREPLHDGYVHAWRQRTSRALQASDALVTTCDSARDLILEHISLPEGKIHVIPHGRDFEKRFQLAVPPASRPIKVVILGAITYAKGAGLLLELARLNEKEGGLFQFHLFGWHDPAYELGKAGVIFHGSYKRSDLPARISEVSPSFSMIPSIWPETFCHTLTESWALGIPVLAAELGAPKERILAEGGGWLLDPSSAERWYRRMVVLTEQPDEYAQRIEEIRRMKLRTTAEMAAEYLEIYRQILARPEGAENHVCKSADAV